MPQERVWLIEPHPHTGQVDREQALSILQDIEATLFRVGGIVNIAAGRERVGVLPGTDKPLYETTHLTVQWQPFAPALTRREPPAPDLEIEPLPSGAEQEAREAEAA